MKEVCGLSEIIAFSQLKISGGRRNGHTTHTSLCILHIVSSDHPDYMASHICNTFECNTKNIQSLRFQRYENQSWEQNSKLANHSHCNTIGVESSSGRFILKSAKKILGLDILQLSVIFESVNGAFPLNGVSTLNIIVI